MQVLLSVILRIVVFYFVINLLVMKKVLIVLLLGFCVSPLLAQKQERFNEEEEQTTAPEEVKDEPVEPKPLPISRSAQKSAFWSRTRFGGNFGAGFGNQFSFANVSPRMYYLATEKLWLGSGITFIWTKNNYYPVPYNQQIVYGLNLSAQYMLSGPIYAQIEYEPLSFERYYTDPNSNRIVITGQERLWAHGVFAGGGIRQELGRGAVFISVLYNLTWSNQIDSYYARPWLFRIGFGL